MKKILIISFSPIRSDPRVMRQVRLLENRFDLTVAGLGEKPEANIKYVEVIKPRATLYRKSVWAFKLLVGAFDSYYWSQYHVRSAALLLADATPDLIIANDLSALPLALEISRDKPVIYDAHEYAPKEHENQLAWRLLFGRYNHAACRKYLSRASSMLTVCEGIADAYKANYGVTPHVVHNAPEHKAISPSPVCNGVIRMIHHGIAGRARHLEVMIDIMSHLDQRFTLDLMLIEAEPEYMALLRARAKADSRIRFIEPVPMPQICQRINEYDLGIYLLAPDNFNHQHALPNKFFEFVQARLAIAIGPSPEMAALVKRYGCGVVAGSFEPLAFAKVLEGITADKLRQFKDASHRAADDLCFERNSRVILSEIERLI